MRTIFSRIKMNRGQVAAAVIFVLIAAFANMLSPLLISRMIDDGISKNNSQLIIMLALGMIAFAVTACITNLISVRISSKITTGFTADLREAVFVKVQTFSAAEIDKFGTASLVTRSTTDVTNIQNFLSILFRTGLQMPMMAVMGVILCVATAGQVSVVLVIAIPVMITIVAVLMLAASRYSFKLRQKIDDINRLSLEALEGVRVIRAFNKQKTEMKRFSATNSETAEITRKSVMTTTTLFPVINALFGITSAGVMAVGSAIVVQGYMEVGTLVSAAQYISMILISIILISTVVSQFPDAYACMNRIAEVLETEASITDSEKETPEKTCRGTVEFRGVTFAYPGADEPVLKDISFISRPGETTAIIGRTGCGKSSIVKLIPRLYDTLFGDVLVDGVNVKDYKLEDLRELIGYVPQKKRAVFR